MTANNETLERIKDEVARDHNYESWFDVHPEIEGRYLDEVAIRYARAVAIDSLKEAAENGEVTSYELPIEQGGGTRFIVDQDSITDEKNIKLI